MITYMSINKSIIYFKGCIQCAYYVSKHKFACSSLIHSVVCRSDVSTQGMLVGTLTLACNVANNLRYHDPVCHVWITHTNSTILHLNLHLQLVWIDAYERHIMAYSWHRSKTSFRLILAIKMLLDNSTHSQYSLNRLSPTSPVITIIKNSFDLLGQYKLICLNIPIVAFILTSQTLTELKQLPLFTEPWRWMIIKLFAFQNRNCLILVKSVIACLNLAIYALTALFYRALCIVKAVINVMPRCRPESMPLTYRGMNKCGHYDKQLLTNAHHSIKILLWSFRWCYDKKCDICLCR